MPSQNQYQPQTVVLDGGLDNITPSITAAPGTLNNCFNFERNDRQGYSRIYGYEKFDGGGSPSLAYTNLAYVQHNPLDTFPTPREAIWISTVGSITVMGYVVEASESQTLLVITNFDEWRKLLSSVPNVLLRTSGNHSLTVNSTSDFDSTYKAAQPNPDSITAKELTEVRNEYFISLSNSVSAPGGGNHPILGLHGYKDQLYGIVDLNSLYFTSGSVEPLPGDTLTNGSVSFIVRGLKLLSGSWDNGDATGLILSNQVDSASGDFDIAYPDTPAVNALTLSSVPLDVDGTPFKAGLFRTNDYNQSVENSVPIGWSPVDTGYQFSFTDGTEYGPPVTFSRGSFADETTDTLSNTDTADVGSTTDSTYNGDPVVTDSWTVTGAPDVATALSSDNNASFVERRINNNYPVGSSLVAGNIVLQNFSAFSGFAGSDNVTIQGIEVTVRAQFNPLDGLAHTSSLAVQPHNNGALLPNSSFQSQEIPYNTTGGGQPINTYTFGGPDYLFGLSAEDMKAAMDSNWGIVIQPWVNPTSGNRIGSIYVYYVTVTVYFTITISGYYFWNGTDDVTAKITNYTVTSGDWSTNDAAGLIQVVDVEPVGSANRTTIHSGDEIWTEPGGSGLQIGVVASNQDYAGLPTLVELEENSSRYEIITANFYANADWEAFYGVSGADRAFSYDGFYFKYLYAIPDADLDKPRHIAFHQFHLALGYNSGAVQLSATGDPFDWNGVNGAVEIDTGDPITGLTRMNGTTLGLFCKKSIQALIGTSSDNFSVQVLSPYEGAIEYTVLDMGRPVYCSYRGISFFDQTAAYGDFAGTRLSSQVSPWLLPRIQGTISPVGEVAASSGPVVAIACRTKNQYRLYFGDGYRLTMTLIGGDTSTPQFTIQADGMYANVGGSGPFTGWIIPRAETSFVDNTGAERIYISHYSPATPPPFNKYYAYEFERSWTFDGTGIPAYIVSNENFYGSAIDYDKFNKVRMHGMSLGYAPMTIHIEPNYKDNLAVGQQPRLAGPISLPRDPAPLISTNYNNVTNIVNWAGHGRSFNFRIMSYDIIRNGVLDKEPLYADVCPPFVLQALLIQTIDGKGDV